MHNMHNSLFFMTFLDLGLDKVVIYNVLPEYEQMITKGGMQTNGLICRVLYDTNKK